MLVLSYLSEQFLARLQEAVQAIDADHVQASSWEDVQDLIRRRPVSVLVVDPYADRANRTEEIALLMQRFPSTPVIVYTEFSPPSLRVLTLLAQYGLQEALLFQVDDDPKLLSRLLVRLGVLPLVLRLLDATQRERRQLTPEIGNAVEDLFKRPHAYTSGRDLVSSSQTPLTSLYRALMEAGFSPPKRLFVAARALHATVYVRDSGTTMQEVAQKIGYQHTRVLTQHTLAVFDRRPSELRTISDDDALPHLLRWTKLEKPAPDPWEAWATLIGYGDYLERVSQWNTALYAYCCMLTALDAFADCINPLLAGFVCTRCGVVLRALGDFTEAHRAYGWAQYLAEKGDVMPVLLRSRIGIANTWAVQGNLGDAEALLNQVVDQASMLGLVLEEYLALHSRAGSRTAQRRHAEALVDFFKAYQLAENPLDRERLLGDLAGCAGDAGYRTLACKAFHVLLRTTQVPVIQSGSLGTLLEFAVYDGDAEEFESLRNQIDAHAKAYTPPVDHVMHNELYMAYGTERFGTREAAIQAYRDLIVRASSIGSHQIAYQAEERLNALLSGAEPFPTPPAYEPPAALRDFVDTLAAEEALALPATPRR